MAEGASREAWGRTSSILCALANIYPEEGRTEPYEPKEFNPWYEQKREVTRLSREHLHMLKPLFERKSAKRLVKETCPPVAQGKETCPPAAQGKET